MKRHPQLGLSQLELMISLAIMALIAILLANALNFNRQALSRSALLSDRTEMYLARETVRNWIEAMPLEYASQTAKDVISGDTQSLSFTSIANAEDNTPPQKVDVRIAIERADAALNLIATVTKAPGTPDTQTVTHLIGANVDELRITYYGRKTDQRGKSWHEDWFDETLFPELIKLEWREGNGRAIPPLTLQPARIARQRVMSRSSLVPPG